MARSTIYRDALQVSRERIAQLSDDELQELMLELMRNHSRRCKALVSEIQVNTEGDAVDDGCDAWSPKPNVPDEWFGSTDTCWQLKAGSKGQPAKLAGEVTKRIPRETLEAGGRFVVVASGSTNGEKGVRDRLRKLCDEASVASIPSDRIEVIGSESLALWVNQYPAVAARFAGRPEGLYRLSDWLDAEEHQVPWQASPSLEASLGDRRGELDPIAGSVIHMHIKGPPGVGKTRLALEVCRGADWSGLVIYIRQAADVRLVELIENAARESDVQLVVVADEVQHEQLRPLRDAVERGKGRVRLITIGHCKTPDPSRIPAFEVVPLGDEQMSQVISGWHPAMPPEHVDFVVRFADGFVRLAALVSQELARNPSIDTRGLLDLEHIQGFFDRMLEGVDRRALHVVAVLQRIGWTDDRQGEGEAVAKHLSLDWNAVRAAVEQIDKRLGIAPRGGRLRYISPTPLGIYLAVEAWSAFPDRLKTLPDILPTEEAKQAYFDRLQEIASNPHARKFAREQLGFFFRWDDFVDARATRRWSALASADPAMAARTICAALIGATVEERRQIREAARRDLVWGLVRLAWHRSAFHRVTVALALLAEAENESWANNATAEFVGRFQVHLGGTSTPYIERLPVLDELLSMQRPAIDSLVIRALAQVGSQHEARWGGAGTSDAPPEPEWHPPNGATVLKCIQEAVTRLTALAQRDNADIAGLLGALEQLSMGLRDVQIRPLLTPFLKMLGAHRDAREPVRRIIADIVHSETRYWKDLTDAEVDEIRALHDQFVDTSLPGRLRQLVGPSTWDANERVDLSTLAHELVNQSALEQELPWLVSGEAGEGWRFGEAIAAADTTRALDELLAFSAGQAKDLRFLAGFASARRRELGDAWYEDWLLKTMNEGALLPLFELSWRCGATPRTVCVVASTLVEREVPDAIVALLGNGQWDALDYASLATLIRALITATRADVAVAILDRRLSSFPEEIDRWTELALTVVTNAEVVRGGQMTGYHWQQVASRLLKDHTKEIVAAIFREQADRSDRSRRTWFAEHSEAKAILLKCAAMDPRGFWQALLPFLSSPKGFSFAIGFPRGLLDSLPIDDVCGWIAADPDERGAMVARLVGKGFGTDSSLASRIVGTFGDRERVAGAFFSAFVSGGWSGPASAHWRLLSDQMARVAQGTKLPKLKEWAERASAELGRMAERDLQREEEEDLET